MEETVDRNQTWGFFRLLYVVFIYMCTNLLKDDCELKCLCVKASGFLDVSLCLTEKEREKNFPIHAYTLLCVRGCVFDRPQKYAADSNQIPVDVSSQQTDQWRLPVRGSDPGLPGSLAVHPPWRLEVKDRGGPLEAGGNGCGGIACKMKGCVCKVGATLQASTLQM